MEMPHDPPTVDTLLMSPRAPLTLPGAGADGAERSPNVLNEVLDEETCWRAVLDRDRNLDSRFYFGVLTTGIFCRPSCPARRPLRRNVRFFATAVEAQGAGLRPCKRCRPLDRAEDTRVQQMEALCTFIREHCDSGEPLTLDVLASRTDLTPSRLRRLFREIVGVTPRAYVDGCRFEALKTELRGGRPVTDAIYAAGFGSSSRVYEQTGERLGMTPGEYGAGGRGVAISYALADTPAGRMLLAATDRGLCSVELGDDDDALITALRKEFPAADPRPMDPAAAGPFGRWMDALRRNLEGLEPHLDLPLDVRASAFRLEVWRYLRTIPRGETRTYAEVARAIGRPRAVRAVGSACGANPVAIAVPCHRVLRSDGGLGGYRWGLDRKRVLLGLEADASEG
ncbi:MAG: bifunctional DNA-binding transcriptional regulator/O6-methylguanine-DNA methyltransferase Ada [Acidobacteriota bacterium]